MTICNQDWHLPSPSSTPTSASFKEQLLQTPKPATTPSHFLDAFTTPQVDSTRSPIQTPLFRFHSPEFTRPSSFQRVTPQDPNFHVNHFPQHTKLPLPPVEPSRRLSSSPTATQPRGTASSSTRPTTSVEMDFAQMQTPPPTRDSTSRRKAGQSQSAHRKITPATGVGRNITTPATAPASHLSDGSYNQTPIQFPSLQFSPDAIPFGNLGPMSAPIYPQQRLFWDPSQSSQGMEMGMHAPEDPFGPTPGRNMNSYNWNFTSPTSRAPTQSFHGVPSQDMPFMPASGAVLAGSTISTQQESFMSTSGVDPSMLFSFSGSLDMIGAPSGDTTSLAHTNTEQRQPYEQQMRESQREREQRELARLKRQHQHSRTSTSSSSSSGQASRPPMQRSKTEGNFRRDITSSSHSKTSTSSNGSDHIPRRTSPLKRLSSHSALTAIPELTRNRPRTRLVIDESGHARTETDRPLPKVSNFQSTYRSQYPRLWDDDDSSDEDEDHPVPSRSGSFACPTSSRPSSKHARVDSLGRSSSVKKPRPSSFVSLTKALEKHSEDELSNSMRRYSMSSFGDTQALSKDSAVESPTDSQGDAQNALKAVFEGRMRTHHRVAQNTLKAHNQRWSRAALDMSRHNTSSDPFTSSPNGLPSDSMVDFATPSTDRSSASGEGTRCICKSNDSDGQFMIQCESCTKWLHAHCVSVNPQSVPSVYLCIFCTGNTPAVRGGRIREPSMASINTYTSPLKYKSTHRR